MFRKVFALIALLSCSLAFPAAAQHGQGSKIEAVDAWARATAGPAQIGAAYAKIVNRGSTDDKLVSAAAPVAGTAELHTMTMDGGVMRMRAVGAIEVKAGGEVDLKPGGLHIMLMGLKAPLKEGQRFPLTLTFASGATLTVEVAVRGIGATGAEPMAPKSHGQGH